MNTPSATVAGKHITTLEEPLPGFFKYQIKGRGWNVTVFPWFNSAEEALTAGIKRVKDAHPRAAVQMHQAETLAIAA